MLYSIPNTRKTSCILQSSSNKHLFNYFLNYLHCSYQSKYLLWGLESRMLDWYWVLGQMWIPWCCSGNTDVAGAGLNRKSKELEHFQGFGCCPRKSPAMLGLDCGTFWTEIYNNESLALIAEHHPSSYSTTSSFKKIN